MKDPVRFLTVSRVVGRRPFRSAGYGFMSLTIGASVGASGLSVPAITPSTRRSKLGTRLSLNPATKDKIRLMAKRDSSPLGGMVGAAAPLGGTLVGGVAPNVGSMRRESSANPITIAPITPIKMRVTPAKT